MGISTSHLREETHNIPLRIAKGHFATNRCHVNYYVDMTYTKHRLAEAHEAARELVRKMDKSSPIDSILCLEGTEAHLIRNRHVLILAASIATGAMVLDAVNAVKYYGGMPEGICAIFSAGQKCAGLPITTIFSSELLGDFMCAPATDCPLCKAGVKLDALVNSYGISSL